MRECSLFLKEVPLYLNLGRLVAICWEDKGARWGAVPVETESLVSGAGEVSQSDPFLSVGVNRP